MPQISLCMPVFRSEEFLKRAIESILDQDFKDWELIICMDGFSKKALEIIRGFRDERIKDLSITHAGACAARNAAAKISTGKYLSFFSSDFQAVPGMLRTWMRTFEEHPEADFLYGGYMFPDRNVYPGEEFDPRQLETYNYIDGGFPLKRELWEKYPWDEKIKSLNDWDFWLRIVKAGHKGYFIPNYYSYIAEYPRPGGLSFDSSNNWIERVKQVRANNNVPNREIVVSSLGAPFFGKNVAKMLDADFIQMPSSKPHDYKMVYLLGFYPQSADAHARVFSNTHNGCKKVVHWLGTDIQQMADLSFRSLKELGKALKETTSAMFVESVAKQEELAEMGIPTEVLPVLRDISKFSVKPLPKNFAVGVYMPGANIKNYNPVLMENVVKNMPDVKFYFFGDRNVKEPQKRRNLEVLGWVSPDEILDKCSVLLRYTIHDGLPTGPMEFIMSGRYVITNAEMPYVIRIEGNQDKEGVRKVIIEEIRKLRKLIQGGQTPDLKGAEYYKDYLNPGKIKNRLLSILK